MMKRLILGLMMTGCLAGMAQSGTKMEAEDATNANCGIVNNSKYSNGKALSLNEGNAKITYTYNCSEAGKYTIYVMGEGNTGNKEVKISVNDVTAKFTVNTLAEVETGIFKLSAGNNTIVIPPSWTWFNID